jgi:hypothetical protein
VVIGALAIGVLPTLAAAKPAPAARPAREAVESRLRGFELPPSEKDLRAFGPGVDEVLVEIAADAKVEVLVRARAVSALAYCSTGPSRQFLERVLAEKAATEDAGERLLLRKAAVALGWLGGPRVPKAVGGLLEHPDPEVRLDAAVALGLTRLATAADLLRARLPVEQDARVRGHIGRQLRVIEAALAPADGTQKPR